jgi:hypothetical protein
MNYVVLIHVAVSRNAMQTHMRGSLHIYIPLYNVYYTYQKLKKLGKTFNIHQLTVFSVANVPDPLGSGLDTFQHTEQP